MQPEISLGIAFVAGILTFFSPCIVPLLPSYLGYLAGDYSIEELKEKDSSGRRSKLLLPSLFFISGFTIIFTLLGLTASWLGRELLARQQLLRQVGGVIVIILGLNMAGLFSSNIFRRQIDIRPPDWLHRYPRAFLLGLVIALAWTPCVGPVLSSILIYAGTAETLTAGALMLAVFSLGLSLPLITITIFMEKFMDGFESLKSRLPLIKKAAGLLIVLVGILIFTGHFTMLSQSPASFLPW